MVILVVNAEMKRRLPEVELDYFRITARIFRLQPAYLKRGNQTTHEQTIIGRI